MLAEGDGPRSHAREVLLKLTEMGHEVYLWSAVGERYAAHAACVLGVEEVVRGWFDKRSVLENIQVVFVVGDHPSWVEEHSACLVRAYDGAPQASELFGVVRAVVVRVTR